MSELNFPGSTRVGSRGFDYFLPGDIFSCEGLKLPLHLVSQVEKTALELGRLSTIVAGCDNAEIIVSAFTRVEATYSSIIEGTRVDVVDAFKPEQVMPKEHKDDWQELHACIEAQQIALSAREELPLSVRLLSRAHSRLMDHPRGRGKAPGEFRRVQNWIGGSRPESARYVPPPPQLVPELMGQLEKFIHADNLRLPHLVKVALIHYQFEAIHPVVDGNGRTGRMLVLLYLLDKQLLGLPVLAISKFLDQYRQEYFHALDAARRSEEGLIRWISFFLDAMLYSARDGIKQTEALLELRESLRDKKLIQLGRRKASGEKLLDLLFMQPLVSVKSVQSELGLSAVLANMLISSLEDFGILREITGYRRNRVFVFSEYIEMLER